MICVLLEFWGVDIEGTEFPNVLCAQTVRTVQEKVPRKQQKL